MLPLGLTFGSPERVRSRFSRLATVRIHLATDHAGLEFSRDLQQHLTEPGHEVIDHGPTSYDPLDDYPSFCINAAPRGRRRSAAPASRRSASSSAARATASRSRPTRWTDAAPRWSGTSRPRKLAREHNDANVISIGARQHSLDEAVRFIDEFIATPFSGEERHARRIAQLAEYETTGAIAGHEIV